MRLHSSLVEQLVRIYSTYGGYKEEIKLKTELNSLDLVVYERASGEKILVESKELLRLQGPSRK